MSEWISVEDRLPEKNDWVLVLMKDIACGGFLVPHVAELRGNDKIWHFMEYDTDEWEGKDMEKELVCEVTHWMPLPNPPEV